jgi:predicted enzyme related to lactoylglutathione lyase
MTQSVDRETTASSSVESRLARPGGLSYMQIPALDPRASATFYEAVFGWNIRGRDTSHVSFDDGTGDVSGAWIAGRAIAREPGILPYIYVNGIDATLEKVIAHGGEVVTAPYPEGDLWVATFHDPAGNVLGVWQAGPRSP